LVFAGINFGIGYTKEIKNEEKKCQVETTERTAFVSKMAQIISSVAFCIDRDDDIRSNYEAH